MDSKVIRETDEVVEARTERSYIRQYITPELSWLDGRFFWMAVVSQFGKDTASLTGVVDSEAEAVARIEATFPLLRPLV